MEIELDRIYIIGAGAIGKALAVHLKLAGKEVSLIRGSVNEYSKRIERIKVELANGSFNEADIEIAALNEHTALDGIVLLASKSYGNEHLSVLLKDKIGPSPVVLLQNGVGVEQPFIDAGYKELYRCILFVTSQSVNESTVHFKPVASCPVGLIRGEGSHLHRIVEALNVPGFSFRIEDDIERTTWKKAITNCVFNSVCALLDTDNGIFYRSRAALEIARSVIAECINIAKDSGIVLEAAEVEETLLQISRSSDGQLISTLQDIRNHRKTEIDALNFAIVNAARRLNKCDGVKIVQLLGELTRIKAELSLQSVL